jgi:hypothetical protein
MLFVLIATVIGVCGGLIAMSGLIVSKRPDAAEKLAKLTPYQGTIGITMFAWGVFELIQVVLNLGLLTKSPGLFVFWALMAVADFTVGTLLGFGMISSYVLRGNAMAIQRGNALRAGLVKFQAPLGGLAILTSLGYLVFSVV